MIRLIFDFLLLSQRTYSNKKIGPQNKVLLMESLWILSENELDLAKDYNIKPKAINNESETLKQKAEKYSTSQIILDDTKYSLTVLNFHSQRQMRIWIKN